jgi:hypothetical protein
MAKSIEIVGKSEGALMDISKKFMLALNAAEMKKIQGYYAKAGRNPTDIELETFAQTWSEHCVHKTFSGIIDYDGKKIDNMLKSYIVKATKDRGESRDAQPSQRSRPVRRRGDRVWRRVPRRHGRGGETDTLYRRSFFRTSRPSAAVASEGRAPSEAFDERRSRRHSRLREPDGHSHGEWRIRVP